MTIPLDQIYQEVILDHNRKPRNFRVIPDASHSSHGVNPLCGDDYRLYLKVGGDGMIQDAAFQGAGCAISKASASMLTQAVKGKPVSAAADLKEKFIRLATRGCVASEVPDPDALGSLVAFEGIRRFPIRVKCATLVWHALEDALKNSNQNPVTRHQKEEETS